LESINIGDYSLKLYEIRNILSLFTIIVATWIFEIFKDRYEKKCDEDSITPSDYTI